MEKVSKNFIEFILSWKKISLTLLVNFVVGSFYYTLIKDGIHSFDVSNVWVVGITAAITIIWIAFWILSYREFKDKKNTIK